MTTPRLIESWLPIAALGELSIFERYSVAALLPTCKATSYCQDIFVMSQLSKPQGSIWIPDC